MGKTCYTVVKLSLVVFGFIIIWMWRAQQRTKKTYLPMYFPTDDDTLKVMKAEYRTTRADKWIVLTTISQPTDDVRYISKLPGWRVVVVGDRNTPQNWTLKNCHFLSLSYQKQMGLEMSKRVPEGSYSRKNVGYLYAIANGAKVIYETDDDNRPLDKLSQFTYTNETTGLMYNGDNGMFNPYRHFGQSSTWPRGYPLSSIGENFSSSYLLGNWRTPLIQQGLVNGDPDVDAIFRLTRKLFAKPLNIRFRSRSPPAFVPNGVYAPFNSQNTLFLYDAFWALFLPSTTSFRVCDIWRGYWAQRLMWEIGGNVGFYPPNAFSKRNQHSYLRNFEQERDLYDKTEKLITFLRKWSCDILKSFFQCVIDLTMKMVDTEFLGLEDGILIQAWINDLKILKYKEPKRIQLKTYDFITYAGLKQQNFPSTTNINFLSQEETPPIIRHKNYTYDNTSAMVNRLLNQCPNLSLTVSNLSRLKNLPVYENILLIINFNNPLYQNIKIMELLYRAQFPYIVYCGKNMTLFKNFSKDLGEDLIFIEAETVEGYFAQICLMKAIQMNYNVDGYFFLMDDLIVNTRKLPKFSFGNIWLHRPNLLQESKNSKWFWFNKKVGRRAYQMSLQNLKKVYPNKYYDLKDMLRKNTGKEDGFYCAMSDISYLPQKYSRDFLVYMDVFTKNNVFLEIAFPTVFAAIERKENWVYLNGTYIWGGNRVNYEKYLHKGQVVFHPIKFAQLSKSEKGRRSICDKIIPMLFF